MSIFAFIGSIFKPACDIVDSIHYSGDEKDKNKIKLSELKNQLAQIEAQVSTKMLELQSQIIEANSKIAVQEQVSGNWLSKSWRPLTSVCFTIMLCLMGTGVIEFNQFLAGIAGGFLGIYAPLRSLVDKKGE